MDKQKPSVASRRSFLKATTSVALAGTMGTSEPAYSTAAALPVDPVVKSYSAVEHWRRLEDVAHCRQAIRSSLRQHLETDYLPAQFCYNLGEYPALKPWSIEAYDEQRPPNEPYLETGSLSSKLSKNWALTKRSLLILIRCK